MRIGKIAKFTYKRLEWRWVSALKGRDSFVLGVRHLGEEKKKGRSEVKQKRRVRELKKKEKKGREKSLKVENVKIFCIFDFFFDIFLHMLKFFYCVTF